LINSNASPKVKTMKEEKVGVSSFVHNTLRVKGHARAPGWGVGWVTSESIIHINLHKPNNKLIHA
jgi:hypothetical protein